MLLAVRQNQRWNSLKVFDWDAGGYYAYLPAVFIYHDPSWVDSLARVLQERLPEKDRDVGKLGIRQLANGCFITKYPPGVAISQIPWFVGAHAYSHLAKLPTSGYFWPYQEAAMLAGLVYAALGLWVVRKLLRRYYLDSVVAWVVAGIGLGTNYFVYTTHEAALSHAVLFLWQASLLYCTARWYETPERRWALGMGLFWAWPPSRAIARRCTCSCPWPGASAAGRRCGSGRACWPAMPGSWRWPLASCWQW